MRTGTTYRLDMEGQDDMSDHRREYEMTTDDIHTDRGRTMVKLWL